MDAFDPTEPAVLHDRVSDTIITWTADQADDYRRASRLRLCVRDRRQLRDLPGRSLSPRTARGRRQGSNECERKEPEQPEVATRPTCCYMNHEITNTRHGARTRTCIAREHMRADTRRLSVARRGRPREGDAWEQAATEWVRPSASHH